MKRTTIFNLFILGFILMLGATACKKKPIGVTTIPGSRTGVGDSGKSGIMDGGTIPDFNPGGFGIEPAPRSDDFDSRTKNRSMFAANTVYFDLDSATVKSSEASNLETVASYFKSNPAGDLLIEGHCDERGTEGYNITLGDKRANALREYLVNLGVSPDRIHTVSLGEAAPAEPGQGEAAWSKNRRGEFIFVEPK